MTAKMPCKAGGLGAGSSKAGAGAGVDGWPLWWALCCDSGGGAGAGARRRRMAVRNERLRRPRTPTKPASLSCIRMTLRGTQSTCTQPQRACGFCLLLLLLLLLLCIALFRHRQFGFSNPLPVPFSLIDTHTLLMA